MNIETKGGVSPLKKRRTGGVSGKKTTRGGTEAGAATSKKGGYLKGRGGYAKSRGIEGGGGQNVGGYNIHTRFVPRKSPTAPKVGSGTSKPYSYDKDGNLIIGNTPQGGTQGYEYKDDPSTTKTTTTGEDRVSYKEAWEKSKDRYTTTGQKSRMGTDENAYNVFANIDEYIDYMERVKEYNKTEEGKKWSKENRKSKTKTVTKIIKGKKYRRSYDEKDGKRTYTSNWEEI